VRRVYTLQITQALHDTAIHSKRKSQLSEIYLLILYNSDMLISNMLVKFGHHVRILHKSNYKFIEFFNSIKIFSLRYFGKRLAKMFIIVSNAKNLETDECSDVYNYKMAKS